MLEISYYNGHLPFSKIEYYFGIKYSAYFDHTHTYTHTYCYFLKFYFSQLKMEELMLNESSSKQFEFYVRDNVPHALGL